MMLRNLSLRLSGVLFLSTSSLVFAVELTVEEEELFEEMDPQESEDPELQKIFATHNLHISSTEEEKEEI